MVEVKRLTDPKEVESVMPLIQEFFRQTRFAETAEFDHDSVQTLLATFVASPDVAAIFTAVEDGECIGAAGALLHPLWVAPGHKTGQELFWYVRPEKRRSKAGKRLFNELEEWARKSGADSFAMVALSHLHENRIGKMYESKGYTPSERTYIKDFVAEK